MLTVSGPGGVRLPQAGYHTMTLLEWTIDGILRLGCFEPSLAYFRLHFTMTLLFATQVRRLSMLVADISVHHHMILMDRSMISLTSI